METRFMKLEEIRRKIDKIDREFSTKLIHTVRGVGYVLKTSD